MVLLTRTSPSILVTFRECFEPPVILHALSIAFGRMYITSSACRRRSSMTNASPATRPINPKENFEMKRSAAHGGKESTPWRISYNQCLKHSKPANYKHRHANGGKIAPTFITVNKCGNEQSTPGSLPRRLQHRSQRCFQIGLRPEQQLWYEVDHSIHWPNAPYNSRELSGRNAPTPPGTRMKNCAGYISRSAIGIR